MAQFGLKPNATFEVITILTEEEARALCELSSFGEDEVIALIEKSLSVTLIKDHAKGLRSFFRSCHNSLANQLGKIDASRKAMQ